VGRLARSQSATSVVTSATVSTLKIASWNINSVRARTVLVERLITEQQPDILCLQETKVLDSIFPFELFDRHCFDGHDEMLKAVGVSNIAHDFDDVARLVGLDQTSK
jgi:mRNA deadenylase 3'-5' endonuclease subunit Ccr4